MKSKSIGLLALAVIVGLLIGGVSYLSLHKSPESEAGDGETVTLYKSPNCGCCVEYIAYLRENGYAVDVVETDDMVGVRQKFNVPDSMESCHTMIIDDYAVEGHVPLGFVDKLLAERPAIEGIALPGMPAGSPGMPGIKRGVFTAYSFLDGVASVFAVE